MDSNKWPSGERAGPRIGDEPPGAPTASAVSALTAEDFAIIDEVWNRWSSRPEYRKARETLAEHAGDPGLVPLREALDAAGIPCEQRFAVRAAILWAFLAVRFGDRLPREQRRPLLAGWSAVADRLSS